MKDFFGRMSFPRAVILFCSLGSLVLGAFVYLRSQRLSEVEIELKRVKEIVKDIQTDAYRLSDLRRIANAEKFKAQSEPESYIRSFTGEEKIEIGQVEITKSIKEPLRGFLDNTYKIVPAGRTQRYRLYNISNFLYRLEHESRRVKLTRVRLTPFEKVTAGEVVKDQWVFEADLTTRTKKETATPAGDQG